MSNGYKVLEVMEYTKCILWITKNTNQSISI